MPCAAVLIDTGGELNPSFDGVAALRDYLDAFFARPGDLGGTLDLLVITHPHIDHTRGVPMVLQRCRVRPDEAQCLLVTITSATSPRRSARLFTARLHHTRSMRKPT